MTQQIWVFLLVTASSVLSEAVTSSTTEDAIKDQLTDAVSRINCLEDELRRYKIDKTVSECGKVNRISRIVGGQTTEENEYPWQTAIVKRNQNHVFCGGSLINDQWIITAAHCKVNARNNQVILGNYKQDSVDQYEKRIDINTVFDHPNYNQSTKDNDFSLLKLHNPLAIMPVCLPRTKNIVQFDDVSSVVTGWGTTSAGGPQPNELQETTVKTMDNNQCNDNYSNTKWKILTSMICAAAPGRDTCQGDSGGPLMTEICGQFVLIGVTSFGWGCADPGYPGVYGRVTDALIWITKTMSSNTNIAHTDPELCHYMDAHQCQETAIRTQCINLCKPKTTDSQLCAHISPDNCDRAYVSTSCPKMCSSQAIECQSPWFFIAGECFRAFHKQSEMTNWTEARRNCQAAAPGADLAEPTDLGTLSTYMCNNEIPCGDWGYWVGASDQASEAQWVWVSGTPLGLGHDNGWAPGAPSDDGSDNYDCLAMFPVSGGNSLSDWPCGSTQPFLCERPTP